MNTNDIQPPRSATDNFGFGNVHPMHAFAIATVSGGFFYYNFLRNKSQGSLIAAGGDGCAIEDDEEEVSREKDLTRPDISPCAGAFTQQPPRFRPYAAEFPSGLQRVAPNELILLDNTYRSRLAHRRHLLLTHASQTYASIPTAEPPLTELQSYLFAYHLPRRFPEYFSLTPSGVLLQNHTSSNTYPIVPQSSTNALRALGENLDEDLVLWTRDKEEFRLAAFVSCFPAGFELSSKLGQTLAQVHRPEEGVDSPLASIFAALKPGVENAVCRFNWAIAKNENLFAPGERWEGDETHQERCRREFKAEKACLRVERLTLWKLPKTGGVVMGVKTYITPLKTIKSDLEDSRELLKAMEQMTPDVKAAKGVAIWGEKVCEYLRE